MLCSSNTVHWILVIFYCQIAFRSIVLNQVNTYYTLIILLKPSTVWKFVSAIIAFKKNTLIKSARQIDLLVEKFVKFVGTYISITNETIDKQDLVVFVVGLYKFCDLGFKKKIFITDSVKFTFCWFPWKMPIKIMPSGPPITFGKRRRGLWFIVLTLTMFHLLSWWWSTIY